MERLKDKASKTFFKIRDDLFQSSFKSSMKLFKALIQPILCYWYGCKVWAPFLFKNLNASNFLSLCNKLPGEIVCTY